MYRVSSFMKLTTFVLTIYFLSSMSLLNSSPISYLQKSLDDKDAISERINPFTLGQLVKNYRQYSASNNYKVSNQKKSSKSEQVYAEIYNETKKCLLVMYLDENMNERCMQLLSSINESHNPSDLLNGHKRQKQQSSLKYWFSRAG